MTKILIIGCGNIGALYDFHNNKILTHAKAFSKIDNFNLSFFDLNISLTKKIAKKYNGNFLKNEKDIDLKNYDCVCISSPTDTHFKWLKYALVNDLPFVICEKPISNSEYELHELLKIYKKSNTKVLVNFTRRFQLSFIELRKYILNLLKKDSITKIVIRYKKGFLNNASHALDLVQFLTSSEINFKKINLLSKKNNHFNNDPTISLYGEWENIEFFILGFEETSYNIFEIDIFFKNSKIGIKNSGNLIDIYKLKSNSEFSNLVKDTKRSKNNCMENYMSPIAEIVKTDLEENNYNDNFVESLNLNLKMLKILK